jgi:hypothetical protein
MQVRSVRFNALTTQVIHLHLPTRFASAWLIFIILLAGMLASASLAADPQNTYLPLAMRSAPTSTPPSWWQPGPGTSWQIQFTGVLNLSLEVQMYDLDLFETAPEVIAGLHAESRRVVCYFSAGSWEDWRPDAAQFPESVLGNDLEGWPGERWLDIRQLGVLGPLMSARLDLAGQKSCDGVDPDNVEGYANNSGFPLTAQDQAVYNTWLAEQAHSRGLAVGLKNDLAQVSDLINYFDWQLNEQCFQYNECDLLLPFIQAGKPVFSIEYQGNPASFCPQANSMNFDTLQKNLDLDAWRVACR